MGSSAHWGKGRGMEFRDVREYSSGDDIRLIDWNVTSRTGELHVKEFYQERDIPVLIFLDLSGSVLNDELKVKFCYQFSVLLGLLHARLGNRIEFIPYHNTLGIRLDPIRTEKQLWIQAVQLKKQIEKKIPDNPETNHLQVGEFLQNRIHNRHLVYWVSDFANFPEASIWEAVRTKHEIQCIQVQSVDSLPLPKNFFSFFQLTNRESPGNFAAWGRSFEKDQSNLTHAFRENIHLIDPEASWFDEIIRIFRSGF
jgi:hypothetical protein